MCSSDLDVSVTFVSTDEGGYYQSFLRDVTEDLARMRKLDRLNRFHRFLLRINHEIAGLRDPDQMMKVFCDTAIEQAGFALVWTGAVDEASARIEVRAASGAARDYTSDIQVSTDPSSPFGKGPTALAARERRTMVTSDFLADSRTSPW